jgi:RNA polymerase sigma-70 factor (ECF subfamily)
MAVIAAPAPSRWWPGLSRIRALATVVRAARSEPALHALPSNEADSLRRRDPEAWHEFFVREMPAIYRYAVSRVGNQGEAEDVTSQVFEEAWEHAEALHDRGLPARAWLFGIARNLVNTHRRRWVQRPPAVALEAFDGGNADPALDPELLDLARGIAMLDRNHAEVISLRFMHRLSLQETAEVLGASVDGVKGRQARALAELRRRLGAPASDVNGSAGTGR